MDCSLNIISISALGLILNVIGSVLFIIDSSRLSGLLANMVAQMAEDHGRMDGKKFTKVEKGTLQQKITTSKKLSFWGYLLFISGFLLQLVAAVS